MPSKSKKQAKFMAGCCHNPEKMENCPPKEVACEFNKADVKRGYTKHGRKS